MRQINTEKQPNGQWTAIDGDFDLGCVVGWGKTEQEAIEDLRFQIEDRVEERRPPT